VKYVPAEADYVDQSWSILPTGRYEVEVLVGPGSGLVPAGPTGTGTAAVRHQLWIEVVSGDETVRRHAAMLAITR
jgi:hypothetical protein